jgi:hypothetical protein
MKSSCRAYSNIRTWRVLEWFESPFARLTGSHGAFR